MNIELEDSSVPGGLGVLHLKRLWSRCLRERHGVTVGGRYADEWLLDNVIYHGLNLPIEETIRFLYQESPSFPDFEEWILLRNGNAIHQNTVERINAAVFGILHGEGRELASEPLPAVLSDEELAFWNEHGYLVVSGLFTDEAVEQAAAAVWQHLEMDRDDPETWYHNQSDHGIMVQFFHHPALDLIRRSPALHRVFAQIWGRSELWISTDRVSFNPPERPGYQFRGPRLHWDVSLELPIPLGVQGLIYLTDTSPEQGAFTCVPGFHTRIENWLSTLPQDADPRNEDLDSLGAIPIPGKAGDLVIWHQALPHGSSPNRAERPRIVEYVTMFPSDAAYARTWR